MRSGMRGFARLGGGACVWPSPRPTPLSLRRRPRSPRSSPRTRVGLGSVNAAARRRGPLGTFPQERGLLAARASSPGARRPGCAEGPPVTAAWLLLQPETLPSPGQTLRLRAPPGTRGHRAWETWALGQQGALWHASAPFPSLAPRARAAGRVPVKCQARLVAAAVY